MDFKNFCIQADNSMDFYMDIIKNKIVIFLDVDGVLNSMDFYKYRYIKFTHLDIDWKAVETLKKFVADDIIFVMSSAKRFDEYERVLAILKEFNFNGIFVGRTPSIILQYSRARRGVEIQKFIDDYGVKRYIIIDDDSDMEDNQLPYFIKTDVQYGLVDNDLIKFNEILKKFKEA